MISILVLPDDVFGEIVKNLLPYEVLLLAQTSKKQFPATIALLLNYVVSGKHAQVQCLLRRYPELIFKKGFVRDDAGRIFESVSAFQYTLWALDRHMWSAMMASIPKSETGIFSSMLEQYRLASAGLEYKFHGNRVKEAHFDFQNTMIQGLQIYRDLFLALAGMPSITLKKKWIEHVGGPQKILPMHAVYEYCADARFNPMPQFDDPPPSLRRVYFFHQEQFGDWFSATDGVGIFKKRGQPPIGTAIMESDLSVEGNDPYLHIEIDDEEVRAFERLYEVRMQDFKSLEFELKACMHGDSLGELSDNDRRFAGRK